MTKRAKEVSDAYVRSIAIVCVVGLSFGVLLVLGMDVKSWPVEIAGLVAAVLVGGWFIGWIRQKDGPAHP